MITGRRYFVRAGHTEAQGVPWALVEFTARFRRKFRSEEGSGDVWYFDNGVLVEGYAVTFEEVE